MPKTADLQRAPTVKEAALMMNVSERMVYLSRRLLRSGRDDLVAAVEAGTMSVNAALAALDKKPPSSRLDRLIAAWNRASEVERAEFLRLVGATAAPPIVVPSRG